MSVGFGLLGSGFMAAHLRAEPRQARPGRPPGGRRGGHARARPSPPSTASRPSRTRRRSLARDDVDAVLICTPHSTHRATDRGGCGRRQARLHREADGRHPRRLRRDDRGLPRRRGPARRQPRDPPSRLAGRRQAPDRRRQHRRAADGPDPELRARLPHARARLGAQGRRGRRVAGHGRPPVRRPALVHRAPRSRSSSRRSAISPATRTSAGAAWPRSSCATASSSRC